MNKFEEAIQEAIKKRHPSTSPPEGQHTIGEFISAVFSITNEKDALDFYKGYLLHLQNLSEDKKSSNFTEEQVAKQNIGWCFGEGMDPSMITMWSNVCQAYHPIFGTHTPTPKEAYEAGLSLGKKQKETP